MDPTTTPPNSPGARPDVIIVGAGLGGLTLAILLEKAGIPYKVLERASSVKPLGSALSLGPTMFPLLTQLGVYDEIVAIGKPIVISNNYDDQGVFQIAKDFSPGNEFGGAGNYVVARPLLYNILYKQVPNEKIHHNKRALTITNGDLGVRVECTDGSFYEGSILVGADGAYSPVRQGMYKLLQRDNLLPSSDGKPLPYNCICLVGQTTPLDPEEFPSIKETNTAFDSMNSIDTPYKWVTFTTRQNTICWMVLKFLSTESSKEHDTFRDSNWGPEAASAMSKEVRTFPVHMGNGKMKTMGDLIDRTPKDLISKVVLEEKVFKTWYSLRTVLLGDACHKLNPAGGAGALTAMQDALCLANWLNVLPTNTLEDISKIFKEYHSERYPVVMDTYRSSQVFAATGDKTLKGALVRLFFSWMPEWLWLAILKKMSKSRPQCSFLPAVADKGTVPPSDQPSLIKTNAILEKLRAVAAKETVAA
ncbi:hypothetical protein BGZ83_008776 [Gryganskiella cystojenkinii]|nr:hypothetical protein BGZ83_008776 [Gryganskiella cystojenkinii]